jgi:NAD-dependent SIR2 family protein deacetylase
MPINSVRTTLLGNVETTLQSPSSARSTLTETSANPLVLLRFPEGPRRLHESSAFCSQVCFSRINISSSAVLQHKTISRSTPLGKIRFNGEVNRTNERDDFANNISKDCTLAMLNGIKPLYGLGVRLKGGSSSIDSPCARVDFHSKAASRDLNFHLTSQKDTCSSVSAAESLFDPSCNAGESNLKVAHPTFKKCKLLTVRDDLSCISKLIQRSKRIVVLTGAGISASCGIPTFRGNGKFYDIAAQKFGLPDGHAIMDSRYFDKDPRPFFTVAHHLYPFGHKPSKTHFFIAALEKSGRLLRDYTQNIDTLENLAGINKVVYCHGSFRTFTCTVCKNIDNGIKFQSIVRRGAVPHCDRCRMASVDVTRISYEPRDSLPKLYASDLNVKIDLSLVNDSCPAPPSIGVMKPDIVFFYDELPIQFYKAVESDVLEADLLLVMGTSLSVAPVSSLPAIFGHIPSVFINDEHIPSCKEDFNYFVHGCCDEVVEALCGHGLDSVLWAEASLTTKTTCTPVSIKPKSLSLAQRFHGKSMCTKAWKVTKYVPRHSHVQKSDLDAAGGCRDAEKRDGLHRCLEEAHMKLKIERVSCERSGAVVSMSKENRRYVLCKSGAYTASLKRKDLSNLMHLKSLDPWTISRQLSKLFRNMSNTAGCKTSNRLQLRLGKRMFLRTFKKLLTSKCLNLKKMWNNYLCQQSKKHRRSYRDAVLMALVSLGVQLQKIPFQSVNTNLFQQSQVLWVQDSSSAHLPTRR